MAQMTDGEIYLDSLLQEVRHCTRLLQRDIVIMGQMNAHAGINALRRVEAALVVEIERLQLASIRDGSWTLEEVLSREG